MLVIAFRTMRDNIQNGSSFALSCALAGLPPGDPYSGQFTNLQNVPYKTSTQQAYRDITVHELLDLYYPGRRHVANNRVVISNGSDDRLLGRIRRTLVAGPGDAG